jgi:hypothetical protein
MPVDPGRPGTASTPVSEPDLGAAVDVLLSLLSAWDADALERQLLCFTVHPEGLDALEAFLLLRNPRLARLEADRAVKRHPRPQPLLEAMREGAGVIPVPPDELHGLMIEDAELEGPLARAWTQGAASYGPGEDARRPWRDRELAAIPLRAGLRPYGLLVVSWDANSHTPARERNSLALQRAAAIASDALGRIAEQRRRTRQADALRELAHAAAASLNLAEALRLGVRLASHATGATGGALWLRGADGRLRLEATHGPAAEREAIARALTPLAVAGSPDGRPHAFESPAIESLLPPGAASGIEALTLAPLTAYGKDRGVLAVYDGHAGRPGEPTPGDVAAMEFLTAAADLIALIAEQAERWDAVRAGERQREELRTCPPSGRLALLGSASRPRRGAPSARFHRGVRAPDPSRPRGERSESRAPRDRGARGRAARAAARRADRTRRARAGVAAGGERQRRDPGSAAAGERDARAPARASAQTPRAGSRAAAARPRTHPPRAAQHSRTRTGGVSPSADPRVNHGAAQHVVVDVANDGPRRAGEMLEQLFVPFHDQLAPGNEPALGVARRIVHEQGGEIRLRSEGEWSTIVSFTLPIAGNQDRRASGRSRRTGRGDRRAVPFES